MALTLSAQTAKEPAPKPYDDPDAYEIYSAVLGLDATKTDLLISDTTRPLNNCLDLEQSDNEVVAAIADYKKANQSRWILESKFSIKQNYFLVSENDRTRPQSKAGGITYFSAIGFSSDRSLAFLEMDFICGGLCGHGAPYILQKRDGKWVVYVPPEVLNPDGTPKLGLVCRWFS
jgi:hypothetical protein